MSRFYSEKEIKSASQKHKKQPGSKNITEATFGRTRTTSRPWSKLQKEIYNLMDDKAELQIHQSLYRMQSQRGSTDIPRYFITLGRGDDQEVIFDYPNAAKHATVEQHLDNTVLYNSTMSKISETLRQYIDTPKTELLEKTFEDDIFGITEILKCADRRIGKRNIGVLKALILTGTMKQIMKDRCVKVINQRFPKD